MSQRIKLNAKRMRVATMLVPPQPKIYHIVHMDRLPSIIADGYLWCDAEIRNRNTTGATIGISRIKERRLRSQLSVYPDLSVGDCVPFYFCPRSVMLHSIHVGNPNLEYRGGQVPIVHLEADLYETVRRANAKRRRWVFTSSNAGAIHFNDYSDLAKLSDLDWGAITARYWSARRDEKQAEFLVDGAFPWDLVRRVGVYSPRIQNSALAAMKGADHQPPVEIRRDWYY